MHCLSKWLDGGFWRRAVRASAMMALAAGLQVAAAGCEQADAPAAAQVAGRVQADPQPAMADAGGSRTAPVVSAPASALRIAFDPPALDFGFIPPNVDMTGTISVHNEGDEPVTIVQAKPTCKCTTLSNLAGAVIEPGGAVTLTTELKGRAMAGPRKAAVRFIFEGYEEVPTVNIRAEVTLPLRTSPSIFNMVGGVARGHVSVASLDGRPFNILATNGQPPRFVDFDPEIDEPRSSYVLEWDLTQELAEGRLPHWWVIETDREDCPLVDAWVRHRSTIPRAVTGRPWRVADRRVVLGVTEPGQSEEFSVEITKIGADSIHAVRSLSPAFDAELLSFQRTDRDGLCEVRITPSADYRGVYQGPLEFMASQHTHTIDVVGKVTP